MEHPPNDLGPLLGKVTWRADEYLSNLDISALCQRIRNYKKISDTLVDRPGIRQALFDTLTAPGFANLMIPYAHVGVPAGIPLFRARKISLLGDVQTVADIWTAPAQHIGAGRVNDAGEPLLYTALDPLTAGLEIHAKPGDLIAMSLFRSSHRILAIDMTTEARIPGLRKGNRRKLQVIMQFLGELFSQKVPTSDPARYITPDLVAKEFFNPDPTLFHGWWYTSVADSRNIVTSKNLSIRGDVAETLVDYKHTQVVRVDEVTGVSGENKTVAVLKKDLTSDRLISVLLLGSQYCVQLSLIGSGAGDGSMLTGRANASRLKTMLIVLWLLAPERH
ncbi:RES domain-containing protein [Arthrobacter sp. Hz1]